MSVNIPIGQAPNGSLIPMQNGPGIATVNYRQDPDQPKTAIIAFNGMNQAVVTFNEFGQAVNYTLFNPAATLQDIQSVQNIVHHISGQSTVQ